MISHSSFGFVCQVRDSAERPLEGDGWWKGADSPWQCLAVCKDLIAALDSPDPSQYLSRLPVHQDGECRGIDGIRTIVSELDDSWRFVSSLGSLLQQCIGRGVSEVWTMTFAVVFCSSKMGL